VMARGPHAGIAFTAIGSSAIDEIVCPDDRFVRVLARI
jgi:hypothetical protein